MTIWEVNSSPSPRFPFSPKREKRGKGLEFPILGKCFRDIEDVREAVGQFVEQYNAKWLLAKLDYQSPEEARQKYLKASKAA